MNAKLSIVLLIAVVIFGLTVCSIHLGRHYYQKGYASGYDTAVDIGVRLLIEHNVSVSASEAVKAMQAAKVAGSTVTITISDLEYSDETMEAFKKKYYPPANGK